MKRNRNLEKTQKLGIPFGTASYRLMKSLLFKLLKENNKNFCYRCNEKILTKESLSIEHKNSWVTNKNPLKSFLNLKNVTFSHLMCNLKASKVSEIPASGYKGVRRMTDRKRTKKFKAVIRIEGKEKSLGYFSTAEEAAKKYDKEAKKHYGLTAITNKNLKRL